MSQNEDTLRVPLLSQQLIAYLQVIAPDRCPDPEQSEREIWMDAGAARLVRQLEHISEQQRESELSGS